MKAFILKIASFLMAFIVLFSTFSFTISQHFCGDELKDSSMFAATEKCEMEMMMNKVDKPCGLHVKKCCDDVVKSFEGQDKIKLNYTDLTIDNKLFTALLFHTYLDLFKGLKESIIPFRDYSPPLVIRQLFKLDETYLI